MLRRHGGPPVSGFRRIRAYLPALALSAAALCACSHTASGSAPPPTAPVQAGPTAVAPGPPPTSDQVDPVGNVWLNVADRGALGGIIADAMGRTLYAFSSDPLNNPTCYDTCAATWSPLLTNGSPAGGIGVDDGALQAVQRSDGTKQVAYQGHPLYYYAGDTANSDAKGQALNLFGGDWHVLNGDGKPIP